MKELERRLRRERPRPTDELVRSITARTRLTRATGVPRVALASALSALMLVALASVGGIGYAANAAKSAATAVERIVKPKKQKAQRKEASTIAILGISAGEDQYRPGFGWGDPNHNHTGPPGLQRPGGEAAPPLRAVPRGGLGEVVSTRIVVDEQAMMYFSVFGPNNRPLLLTQRSRRGGSVIGQGVNGPQAKFIRYRMLVPRTIPIQLRVPANLLTPGQTYRIRIAAIDAEGNKTITFIPFST